MATNLQGSSHRPRAVGFRLRNRKDFIYEKENLKSAPYLRPGGIHDRRHRQGDRCRERAVQGLPCGKAVIRRKDRAPSRGPAGLKPAGP